MPFAPSRRRFLATASLGLAANLLPSTVLAQTGGAAEE